MLLQPTEGMNGMPQDVAEPGFAALGLESRLIEVLTGLGYEEPTPIQSEAIPPLIEGRDLVGQAATGTGKTAAFALPLLTRLAGRGADRPRPSSLILVPTRELAMQVAEAVHRYGRSLGINVLPIYGGQSFSQQVRVLKRGVDVVVATPGRALDHVNRGTLQLDGVESLVLDEADEMLDMGFADDLEALLAATPANRQTVLFSATIPPRIAAIAKRHLDNPIQIRIAGERIPAGEVGKVRQTAYIVARAHKLAALARVLDVEDPEAAIVFCRTRTEVDELAERLTAHGHLAEALHGGLTQDQRDRIMKKFRGGTVDLLIATDVAGRGLDIPRLTHVVNYDVPNAPEAYVHRIGRVGRAGREGVAITLAEPREHRYLRSIEQLTRQKIAVARVPTVADLRARRLELLRAALRETLVDGDLDACRVVVESLAAEFDPMDVAAAAVKLARDASGADSDVDGADIPEVTLHRERSTREARPGHADRKGGAGPRGRPESPAGRRVPARRRGGAGGFARLYFGAGRNAGVRPQDLVGAITGESGIAGREIGAIDIAEDFAIVEVTETVAAEVIRAMRGSKLKGRKVTVRRETGTDD
jgi:ATP-dependent RNA helicase DeaD